MVIKKYLVLELSIETKMTTGFRISRPYTAIEFRNHNSFIKSFDTEKEAEKAIIDFMNEQIGRQFVVQPYYDHDKG